MHWRRGQRTRSHGYENGHSRTVASDHVRTPIDRPLCYLRPLPMWVCMSTRLAGCFLVVTMLIGLAQHGWIIDVSAFVRFLGLWHNAADRNPEKWTILWYWWIIPLHILPRIPGDLRVAWFQLLLFQKVVYKASRWMYSYTGPARK